MTTSEKVAYLKGLTEGLGIDPAQKEGKILSTILDILEDLALDQEDLASDIAELDEGLDAVSDDQEDLASDIAELDEGLDAVSDDLEDVETVLFGDPEDEDEDWDDEEAEDWDGETTFYECECPVCGETVTFDEDVLAKGSIQCPACGETLEFDTGSDEAKPEE